MKEKIAKLSIQKIKDLFTRIWQLLANLWPETFLIKSTLTNR